MNADEANKAIKEAELEWIEVRETAFSARRLAIVAAGIATIAFILACASMAFGAEPLGTAMARLPVYFEDRADPELKAVQLQDIARAIEQASVKPPGGLSPKDWQALLVTVAYWETTLSIRIHQGKCKPHECDRGRSRGPWQQKQNVFTRPIWDQLHGIEHVDLQAQAASDFLRRSFGTCSRSGQPWLVGTLNAYAGRRCSDTSWEGLHKRTATWRSVRARL